MNTKQIHSGDAGQTEILSGKSVPKNDPRIETLGELDEVQSILGVIRSLIKKKDTKELLVQIQDDLRLSMGEIASDKADFSHANSLDDSHLVKIDKKIQEYQEQIELPKDFITPGDSFTSAMIDLGRTITRRAERRVAGAFQAKIVRNQTILRYVNRLSTLLFFMEIHEMKQAKNHKPIHNHIV